MTLTRSSAVDRMMNIFLELGTSTTASQSEVGLAECYFELCRDRYGVVAVRETYKQFLLFQKLDMAEYNSSQDGFIGLSPFQASQPASQPNAYGNVFYLL